MYHAVIPRYLFTLSRICKKNVSTKLLKNYFCTVYNLSVSCLCDNKVIIRIYLDESSFF